MMEAFLAALGLVFLAELGDKTQLVALGFGARHRLAPVLVGMACGFGASSLLAVGVGTAVGAALPTGAIRIAAGILFLGFAAWTLRGEDDDDDDADGASAAAAGGRALILSVATAIFLAEVGDKTMLATAAVAAEQGAPLAVWAGATLGEVLAAGIGLLAGKLLGKAIPARPLRWGSAAIFAAFGVALLLTG